MSLAIDIADAVAAELNGGEFSFSFTAARRVLPEFELKDLGNVQVSVVPRAIEIATLTRRDRQADVQIDVGVQRRVQDLDVEVPALCGLVEEMEAYLRQHLRPAALPTVCWLRSAIDPTYSVDHLRGQRVFTSVVTVTYRTVV